MIEVPARLDEKQVQSLRENWERMQGGLENAHKTAILQGGAKLNPYSINARDSQLLETRQFEIREIALWIGVPPHKLGDSKNASYNSLSQENQSYLNESLNPWLIRWEEEIRMKLLTEEEKKSGTVYPKFNRKELASVDLAARQAYFVAALGGSGKARWMTPNEVREEEDLNPIEGWDGEEDNMPAGSESLPGQQNDQIEPETPDEGAPIRKDDGE